MYYNILHQYPYLFIEGSHKSENFYWENVISMTSDSCKLISEIIIVQIDHEYIISIFIDVRWKQYFIVAEKFIKIYLPQFSGTQYLFLLSLNRARA